MRLLVPLVLLGCQPNTLPDDTLPPAPGFPNFVVGDMVAGVPSKVTWEDPSLVPGNPAVLLLSSNGRGAGPCPGVLGGACIELLPPLRRVARANVQPSRTMFGSSGAAWSTDPFVIFDVVPPPFLPPNATFSVQVAVEGPGGVWTLSPPRNASAGFSSCPGFNSPTCGVDGSVFSTACATMAAGLVVGTPQGEGC